MLNATINRQNGRRKQNFQPAVPIGFAAEVAHS